MDKEKEPLSDVLLVLSRTWLCMALGALMLYFIVAAIERSRVTIAVTTTRSYRVPIEHAQESEAEDNG